ncbi:hypothetical protein C7446_0200 [Kushneria sinocarnis]|uniref:Uncharacterized protein n=2 Tax=Kushneria sinocarnis TaxID=595502 RepID=A0A420X0K8_9GAMM|nr:hypothetical protein C7446_0200 [Kushneria sinocarnis]
MEGLGRRPERRLRDRHHRFMERPTLIALWVSLADISPILALLPSTLLSLGAMAWLARGATIRSGCRPNSRELQE